jgi:calcineurin-like phosphoesterase family protein
VGEGDVVYHIGDFSMIGASNVGFYEKIMKQYKKVLGRHLILGNHDRLKPTMYLDLGFTSVHTSFPIYLEKYLNIKFLLIHDPCFFQPGLLFTVGICGHIHRLWDKKLTLDGRFVYNVGVDVRDFAPISLDEVAREVIDEGYTMH